MLISKIKNCLNNASSCKTNKKRDREMIPRKNWISSAIIISCKKKEMLYKLWKMKPDCKDLKNEYKNYSKLLDKVIKDAKLKFERNKIEKSSKDPKKLWEIINNKLGKTKKANMIIDYIYANKNKIVNKEDIANLMNTYFCKVGANLSKNIKQPNNVCVKPIVKNTKAIFIRPTNTVEICKIINDLKEKVGGVDDINAKSIKTIAP